MYAPKFRPQKVENSEQCYANYIKALATINKLLLENYYDELRAETFDELNASLDAVQRTCSPWSPLWVYANWALSAVNAAKKPTRDNFMKVASAPYQQGQHELHTAFQLLMDDKPEKQVRDALLEAIRLTLHEPLQIRPLAGSSPQIDIVFDTGTELSNLREKERGNYEEPIERIVAEGLKKLSESYV